MTKLRDRLRAQNITAEQFFFQFLIVALGVWLAIVIGNRTTEAAHRAHARATLKSVLEELRKDEAQLNAIIANQRRNQQTIRLIASEVRRPVINDSTLRDLLQERLEANRTFFPHRAAYTMLVNAGQLEEIDDADLRLRIAALYDHDYVRTANAGQLSDEISFALRYGILELWDYERNRSVGTNASLKVSNLAHRFLIYTGFHLELLEQQLKEIRSTAKAIQTYLGDDT